MQGLTSYLGMSATSNMKLSSRAHKTAAGALGQFISVAPSSSPLGRRQPNAPCLQGECIFALFANIGGITLGA